MKGKKCRIFLLVSFTLFAISVIAVISSLIFSYYQIKTDFPNDDIKVANEFGFGLMIALYLISPFLGLELSCIRSTYKILKHEPRGYVKICYIISSFLAFWGFAFYCFASFGLISFVEEGGHNHTAEILLYTQWPAFILSFILGSIPVKHND